MLGVRIRSPGRCTGQLTRGPAAVLCLDPLEAALALTDVLQLAVYTGLVFRRQRCHEPANLAGDPVKDAGMRPPTPSPFLGGTSSAKELGERRSWITDHGQWRGWRRPADRVRIDARVTTPTTPSLIDILDAELQRGNRRLLPEPLSEERGHRCADENR